jgi:hypothetical protein
MAIYLREDHIGADLDTVGFPNLSTCLAVVVQTTTQLYGYHIASQSETERVEQLLALIHQTEPQAQMVHLYGSCYWANRYPFSRGTTAATQWEAEMGSIADTLQYTGPVSGFDFGLGRAWNLSARLSLSNIPPTQYTYLEYRRQGNLNTCTLHYKRGAKVTFTAGVMPADMLVERIRPLNTNPPTFQRVAPPGNMSTLTATVTRTSNNQGQLHSVAADFIRSFDH